MADSSPFLPFSVQIGTLGIWMVFKKTASRDARLPLRASAETAIRIEASKIQAVLMWKFISVALFITGSLSAQVLSPGVIAGAPFNDVVYSGVVGSSGPLSAAESANYTVGGSLQVNLPANFRLEGDVLYRPYDLTLNYYLLGLEGGETVTSISASQFRFPVLLQYRFGPRIIKPFVEAGASIDHLANISATTTSVLFIEPSNITTRSGGIPTSGPGELIHETHTGIVIGGGVDVKIPFIRLSAEVRYSRQGQYFQGFSNTNEGEVLLGIHF